MRLSKRRAHRKVPPAAVFADQAGDVMVDRHPVPFVKAFGIFSGLDHDPCGFMPKS
jgi:hypothetical protein